MKYIEKKIHFSYNRTNKKCFQMHIRSHLKPCTGNNLAGLNAGTCMCRSMRKELVHYGVSGATDHRYSI